MTQGWIKRGRILAVAGAIGAATFLAACAGESGSDNQAQSPVDLPNVNQSALHPESPEARSILDLFTPFFWIAVVIGVLVVGAVIYSAIRFRARSDDDRPVQVHGSTGIEIGWTVVPALILAVMAVPTVATVLDLAERPDEALHINITGKQWFWEFEYPDQRIVTANEMHIPAGVPISLNITSADVIHSFWVPNLAGKVDAVPGRNHFLKMTADEPAVFLGQCAEYCGLSHANMRIRVIAEEPGDFEAWVADQQRRLTPQEEAFVAEPVEAGGVIQKYGCTSCHSFDPSGEGARVGPNLTHLDTRTTFAGAIFDLTEENLRQWLRNAPSMKPMQTGDQPGDSPNTPGLVPGMPPFTSMSDAEVDELVTFLLGTQ